MLYLYFVRHAQTEWNAAGKIQGRQDSDLTEKGIQDAKLLAEKFKTIDWKAIYTSPSTRAVKTLKLILGESSPSYLTDNRLMEMDLGNLEGLSMEKINSLYPRQYNHYWHQPSKYSHSSGENFFDVKERIEGFINDLLATYSSGHVLVLTHGVVVKMVQLLFGGLEMDQLWQTAYIEGTSVTSVKVENGQTKILLEGDLSHLSVCTIETDHVY